MIAKKSDLVLKNFSIVDSQLSFNVPADNKKQKVSNVLNSYPVNIDFSIEHNNENRIYRIVVSVDINNALEVNKAGYSIGVTGIGFFDFDDKSELSDDQKIQLLRFSGLSICITNLRSYIFNQTSYFPWGSYSFHSVDIQDLLLAKSKTSEEVNNK